MNLPHLNLLTALTQKMNWLTDRQKVLAENVANIDTPRYRASDLRPLDFGSELSQVQQKLQPVTTDPGHISLVSAELAGVEGPNAVPDDMSLNGNTVSLEEEMVKVSKTASDYQLMTNLYKKQLGMIKLAIGQSSGSS